MKIHPLLLPYILNMSSEEIQKMEEPSYRGERYTYYGKIIIDLSPENVLYLAQAENEIIGENNFKNNFNFGEKLKKHLMGKPLDLFLDVPLAHKMKVINIENRNLYFESDIPNFEFDEIPKISNEGIKLIRARDGFERLKQTNIEWQSQRIFQRYFEYYDMKSLVDILEQSTKEQGIGFTKEELKDESIKGIVCYGNSRSTFIFYSNNLHVENPISLGETPYSTAYSLVGKDAKEVIDHWLFNGAIIKSIENSDNTLKAFLQPEKENAKFEDLFSQECDDIERHLSHQIDNVISSDYLNFRDMVMSLEDDCETRPGRDMRSVHLNYTSNGQARS